LKPNIQSLVLRKINAERHATMPPLLLISSTDQKQESLLSLGLRSDWVIDSNTSVQNYIGQSKLLCEEYFKMILSQVYFMSSPSPQSGKSTTILQDFVFGGAGRESLLYTRIPLAGNLDEVADLLISVARDRESYNQNHPATRIVYHFNVSSTFELQQLNKFLLSYVITGVCTEFKW